jgi:hypothetical protein
MSRSELEHYAPFFRLPYTADSMRAPLRDLGIPPLETRPIPGTKTSQMAFFDPVVLWPLSLSYSTAKSWRPRKASQSTVEPAQSLKSLLEEYQKRAESMAFTTFVGGAFSEPPVWTWRRVTYWRLLVDPEYGLDLRLLDRIVAGFRDSIHFDMSGHSVLPVLLERYKLAVLTMLGSDLGGAGMWFDPWTLLDEVLVGQGLLMEQPEAANTQDTDLREVVQRRD